MAQLEPLEVHRQVAIAGRVTDALTGQPLEGAHVRLASASKVFKRRVQAWSLQRGGAVPRGRPDETGTGPDGHFHFLDLPRARYTVTASLPGQGSRYASARTTVEVTSSRGEIPLVAADLALQPTAIKGRVTTSGGDPLPLAEVRVAGGPATRTDAQGRYVLAGVEAGRQRATANATGLEQAEQMAAPARPGSAQTVDFSLASPSS